MPEAIIHRTISKTRTGKTYDELHTWIDDGAEAAKRHEDTPEIRQQVSDLFGGNEAVSELLFHIALDKLNDSVMFDWKSSISDSNVYKLGFEDNGFVQYREYNANDEQLEDEFSEDDET
jgi:hypothetical protein